jgi:hypothetical protein
MCPVVGAVQFLVFPRAYVVRFLVANAVQFLMSNSWSCKYIISPLVPLMSRSCFRIVGEMLVTDAAQFLACQFGRYAVPRRLRKRQGGSSKGILRLWFFRCSLLIGILWLSGLGFVWGTEQIY